MKKHPTSIRRYLHSDYIESLKKDGELKLSTFAKCRKHEDIRSDILEGVMEYKHKGKKITELDPKGILKGSSFEIKTSTGSPVPIPEGAHVILSIQLPNVYLLSCSEGLIKKMQEKFGHKSYFTISDAEIFGQEIHNALIRSGQDVLAYCFDWVEYVTSKNYYNIDMQEKKNVRFNLDTVKPPINLSLLQRHFHNYFIKNEKGYRDEKEFRFVFSCTNDIDEDGILLKLEPEKINPVLGFYIE